MLASILALSIWGLNLGIDFTGGSLLEVQINSDEIKLTAPEVKEIIEQGVSEIGDVQVQPTQDGFLIRMQELSEERHQLVLSVLHKPKNVSENLSNQIKEQNPKLEGILSFAQDDIQEKRFESIGPVIG
ncbi:hypothetical protein ACFL1Y_01290, partial [Patescibacteria group bacterium]